MELASAGFPSELLPDAILALAGIDDPEAAAAWRPGHPVTTSESAVSEALGGTKECLFTTADPLVLALLRHFTQKATGTSEPGARVMGAMTEMVELVSGAWPEDIDDIAACVGEDRNELAEALGVARTALGDRGLLAVGVPAIQTESPEILAAAVKLVVVALNLVDIEGFPTTGRRYWQAIASATFWTVPLLAAIVNIIASLTSTTDPSVLSIPAKVLVDAVAVDPTKATHAAPKATRPSRPTLNDRSEAS
jgi:hypothetical protein